MSDPEDYPFDYERMERILSQRATDPVDDERPSPSDLSFEVLGCDDEAFPCPPQG